MSDFVATENQKEHCALSTMRIMLNKISREHNTKFTDELLNFAKSKTYDTLFDFSTGVWREGPEYLLSMYNQVN